MKYMAPTLPPETPLINRTDWEKRPPNSAALFSYSPVSTRAVHAAAWMPPPMVATRVGGASLNASTGPGVAL
jgi:hypothetical protein